MPITSTDLQEPPPKRSRWLRLLWLPPLLLLALFLASLFRPLHLTLGNHHLKCVGEVHRYSAFSSSGSIDGGYFDVQIGTWAYTGAWWSHRYTTASLRDKIRREVPLGSPPAGVDRWLSSQQGLHFVEYETGLTEANGVRSAIYARAIHDTPGGHSSGISYLSLTFYFDGQCKLIDVKVKDGWSKPV